MQYILSEAEYRHLTQRRNKTISTDREKLQKFCTHVANTMEIFPDWAGSPMTWGCIRNDRTNRSLKQPEYCDDCPAREVCPHDRKEWSK